MTMAKFRRFIFAGDLVIGDQVLAPPDLPDTPFKEVKSVEELFPIPTPSAIIDVGTLDGFTGAFEGLVSTIEILPPTPGGGPGAPPASNKPQVNEIPPAVEVDAVNVQLRFKIENRQADFSVTANGITVSAPQGVDELTIDVGSAHVVDWTVDSGPDRVSDRLVLRRPPIIGAGSFKLPVFPVTIIYEPPRDRQAKNKATYGTSKTIGTKVSISFSDEESTTRPARSSFFHLNGLRTQIELFVTALQTAAGLDKEEADTKIIDALNVIAKAIGKASATQTSGLSVTSDQSVTTKDTVEEGISTGSNDGGPGIGDVIVFLRDVELAWLANAGHVSLGVLSHGAVAMRTVKALKEDLVDNQDEDERAGIEALLALDPFAAAGGQAQLDPKRFGLIDTFELNGVDYTRVFTHQVTTTDREAKTEFSVKTEEMRKGFLSFLGLGVPETVTVKSTATHSSSVEESQSETASISVHLHAEADEHYAVEVYFDRVFGTFAIREVPISDEPSVAGRIVDSKERPLPGQLVTLRADDKDFTTITDAEGRFSFHIPQFRADNASLTVAGAKTQLQVVENAPLVLSDLKLSLVRADNN
jgi:hypothetical protein